MVSEEECVCRIPTLGLRSSKGLAYMVTHGFKEGISSSFDNLEAFLYTLKKIKRDGRH